MTSTQTLPRIGAQPIVFGPRYDLETDTDYILDGLAAAGYAAIEGGTKDAAAYKRKLDERGLVYAGSHLSVHNLRDVGPLIDYLRAVDSRDVCNSGFLKWGQLSLQDYRDGIAILNEAGRKLREAGIFLHYHNHDFEFQKVDGQRSGMDVLFDELDPACVDFCVDVAWVQRGGANPAEFLARHQDRIGYLHFKDFSGADWSELGRGEVDFKPIMQVLPAMSGVRWVVIEQDSSKIDPMESMTISRRYLRDTFRY